MSASGSPIMLALSVDSTGGVMDFEQAIEAVALANSGPNTVYLAFGATPPTASVGNGRYAIPSGGYLNLDDLKAQKIAFRCAAAETAEVQAVGIPVGRVAIGPFGMTVSGGSGSGGDDSTSTPPAMGGGQVQAGPKSKIPLVIISANNMQFLGVPKDPNSELQPPGPEIWSEPKLITAPDAIDISDCQSCTCSYFEFSCDGNPNDAMGDTTGYDGKIKVEANFVPFGGGSTWVELYQHDVSWLGEDYSTRLVPHIASNNAHWVQYGWPASSTQPSLIDTSNYKQFLGIRVSVYNQTYYGDYEAQLGQNFTVSGKMCIAFSTDALASKAVVG